MTIDRAIDRLIVLFCRSLFVPALALVLLEISAPAAASQGDSPPSVQQPSTFASEIAPIFAAKCGRCHIDATRGKFSMATINALVKDPKRIVAGQPGASQVFVMVESGEMPKGRDKLTADELQKIRDWIQAGADFGETDRDMNLKSIAGVTTEAPNSSTAKSAPAKGSAGAVVSFAKDVAPVLVDQCADCHMNGQRVRANLNMSTFQSLSRGGDNGAVLKPGQGEESLLIKKLRGTGGGQQMPAGSEPLRDEVIGVISRWIDQGSRFDGGNPNANMRDVILRATSAEASHEELAQQREERAAANWKLVMDGKTPIIHSSDNLIVLAPDAASKPERFAEIAESVLNRVSSQLRISDKEPLIKGKITAYLFAARYDYGEFGKMIERRDLPREWTNHWGNNQIDAYIAFQIPPADYDDIRPWIARDLAAAYAKGLAADVPDWFANGMGYSVAAKIFTGDKDVKQWLQRAGELTGQMKNRDDFIAGRLSDDDAGLVAFQFVEFLKQVPNKRFNRLIVEMRSGASFERAFAIAFEVTPAEMLGKQESK